MVNSSIKINDSLIIFTYTKNLKILKILESYTKNCKKKKEMKK